MVNLRCNNITTKAFFAIIALHIFVTYKSTKTFLESPNYISNNTLMIQQFLTNDRNNSNKKISKRNFRVGRGKHTTGKWAPKHQLQSIVQPKESSALSSTVVNNTPIANPTSAAIISSRTSRVASTTLALLFPPGLFGGYRNQVIRFMSLCITAKQKKLDQLLLPSLLWRTQIHRDAPKTESQSTNDDSSTTRNIHIPMETVFDIEHWNSFAPQYLPKLVTADIFANKQSDCWSNEDWTLDAMQSNNTNALLQSSLPLQKMVLKQGGIIPIKNASIEYLLHETNTVTRRKDYSSYVQHCKHPVVYGGGTHAGVLWKKYVDMRDRSSNNKSNTSITINNEDDDNVSNVSTVPYDVDKYLLQALRPAKVWREVAEQCVRKHASNGQYIALHARIELDMVDHVCGQGNEHQLDKIFNMTASLSESYANTSGVFVAVSRSGMVGKGSAQLQKKHKKLADANNATLNRYVGNNVGGSVDSYNSGGELLGSHKLRVFECGEQMMHEYYGNRLTELGADGVIDYGSLLESVLNFYIAVNADVFIGVRQSSYSTDILTTRYHLGKGDSNYRYTKHGKVEKVIGLPSPHVNCVPKRKAQK